MTHDREHPTYYTTECPVCDTDRHHISDAAVSMMHTASALLSAAESYYSTVRNASRDLLPPDEDRPTTRTALERMARCAYTYGRARCILDAEHEQP